MSTGPQGSPLSPTCIQPLQDGSTALTLRAQPAARRSGFVGLWNGLPKIAVTAPPSEDRANAALVVEIARLFGLRPSAVSLRSGATSRAKTFRLESPARHVRQRLEELIEDTR